MTHETGNQRLADARAGLQHLQNSQSFHGASLSKSILTAVTNHPGNRVPTDSLATMPSKVKSVLLNLCCRGRKMCLLGNSIWLSVPLSLRKAQLEGTPSFHRLRAVLCGQAAVMEKQQCWWEEHDHWEVAEWNPGHVILEQGNSDTLVESL